MKKLTSTEIRRMWLDFFASKGHMIEPGASLIPMKDPTLLWVNSGVAALKKYFDGSVTPNNRRITNVQKSIRTNDIEHVGLTARHHTFFEMLGNFSIGDYFKKEAVIWGFEILTSPKWFDFDLEKLYFTVHPSDQETADLWHSLGVKRNHIIFLEGNFWEIGEGPCGPNTEIFYDRGTKYDPSNIGSRLIQEDIENDRYIEIWNIVFSQFSSKPGLARENYPVLPSKNIDTGCGLERLVCIMQEAETNFDTDLFTPIIAEIEKMAQVSYRENPIAYRVIADHIRTCTFALADGALFSNEGRGYVLRRILRRAVRFSKKIGIHGVFLEKLVPIVAEIMKDYYGYIKEKINHISRLIRMEEERFHTTLNAGEQLLLEALHQTKEGKILSGDVAFKLYDTYGFPLELTVEIAQENGFSVDEAGFKVEMQKQKERARSARGNEQSFKSQSKDLLEFEEESIYHYENEPMLDAKVIALFKNGELVDSLTDEGEIVFDHTNFYAESGGQVSDSGKIIIEGVSVPVLAMLKAPHHQHLHSVKLPQGITLEVGVRAELQIDSIRRNRITRHHSSAHLLQKALIEVLGDHITQAGSYVDDTKVRFDFTHFEKLTKQQLSEIEARVNQVIDLALPVSKEYMSLDEAKNQGATALFSEKYESVVRVVSMGDYSKELCGGCHVSNSANIGSFVIESEESISSGIRRIVGTVGLAAYESMKKNLALFEQTAQLLGALSIYEVHDRLEAQLENAEETKKQLEAMKIKNVNFLVNDLLTQAIVKNGYQALITKVQDFDKESLAILVDTMKAKLGSSFVYVANIVDDKISLIASASQDVVTKQNVHCGKIIKETAQMLGGNGGGRPDHAQAGGKELNKVDEVLSYVRSLLK